VDNDGDMVVDCDDPDCEKIYPCLTLAPVMSPTAMPLLVLLLGLVGLVSLLRTIEFAAESAIEKRIGVRLPSETHGRAGELGWLGAKEVGDRS
jgi:hypothetical protein